MTDSLESPNSEQVASAAAVARAMRERRSPEYLALLDAAIARAKGEEPKPRPRKWGYR